MRVIVAGRLVFADASPEEIIRAGAAHIAASRAEAGCVAYNWAADPLAPGTVHVYEEWESEQALLRHFRDPSYLAMRAHLERHPIAEFDVKLYGVSGIEPVYRDDGSPRPEIFGVAAA